MIAPINFELAKLLKEKGFDEKTYSAYVDTTPFSESKNDFVEYAFVQNHNKKEHRVSAPTIAEVVMWLYEKHGIWIWVEKNTNNLFTAWVKTNIPYTMPDTNSPTEAYEAAIEYVLLNLI